MFLLLDILTKKQTLDHLKTIYWSELVLLCHNCATFLGNYLFPVKNHIGYNQFQSFPNVNNPTRLLKSKSGAKHVLTVRFIQVSQNILKSLKVTYYKRVSRFRLTIKETIMFERNDLLCFLNGYCLSQWIWVPVQISSYFCHETQLKLNTLFTNLAGYQCYSTCY